ncbi:hypothetical protein M569_07276, partial [Genlisea aurea]
MSWFRSAVNKAVEAGGGRQITRTVRGYADSVVGQAVSGRTKLLENRAGAQNFENYKLATKRLEEVSVSCTGAERVQLLKTWLVALKELEGHHRNDYSLDKSGEMMITDSLFRPTLSLYYGRDLGEEGVMSFRDVFLHSQALEGITLSLILEAPSEEELSLLKEIFSLCLTGGKEVLDFTLTSVQEMARAFSSYNEEVLAKREELLQYAQDAIAGLKVNSEKERIDSEACSIHKKVEDKKSWLPLNEISLKTSENLSGLSTEDMKEASAYIGICSQLEELLLRKKCIKNGDSPEARSEKIDKLKVLLESLSSSASKAEKRISELRAQKEDALKYRVAKTSEVSQLQKEYLAEINALETRKEELEKELRKVTTALNSTYARLRNAGEERDQFDEASNNIIRHLKLKDDELAKSITLYRSEAKVCSTFIDFLERTWIFQTLNAEENEKLVSDELEKHRVRFSNSLVGLLCACK